MSVRDDIKPSRQNQILLAKMNKGKKITRAQALEVPVLKFNFISHLWNRREELKLNISGGSNNSDIDISKFKVRPFQDCTLYFHGFEEDEYDKMKMRTIELDGTVTGIIKDPAITHIVLNKPYDNEFLQFLDEHIYHNNNVSSMDKENLTPNGNVNGNSHQNNNNNNNNNNNIKNSLNDNLPILVKLTWFWESVKAESKAEESKHTIYLKELNRNMTPDNLEIDPENVALNQSALNALTPKNSNNYLLSNHVNSLTPNSNYGKNNNSINNFNNDGSQVGNLWVVGVILKFVFNFV